MSVDPVNSTDCVKSHCYRVLRAQIWQETWKAGNQRTLFFKNALVSALLPFLAATLAE